MGSIRHEIVVNLKPQELWAAVRDVGAGELATARVPAGR
jgi:hypothetical protein